MGRKRRGSAPVHAVHDALLRVPLGRARTGSRAAARRRLLRAGYDVTYDEFDGPHTVRRPVAGRSCDWLAGIVDPV